MLDFNFAELLVFQVARKMQELITLNLDTSKITASEVMELGWLFGTLTKEQLETVSPTLMNHVSYNLL